MRNFDLHFSIQPGERDDIPLLVFPGLGLSGDVLSPLFSKLTGSTVIAIDPPGMGRSPLPLLPYTFKALADYLSYRLQKMGYHQVDLFGYSWGGLLAQEMALRHSNLCRKVVLAATTMGVVAIPGNPLIPIRISNPYIANNSQAMLRVAAVLNGETVENPESLMPPKHKSCFNATIGHYYQILATSHWTSFHRLPRLRQPVLLMHGSRDPLIPSINVSVMERFLPQATVASLDSGHLFPVTKSAAVAELVDTFRF